MTSLRLKKFKGRKSKVPRTINGSHDPDVEIFRTTFRINSSPYTASNTNGTVIVNELDLSPSNWGPRGVAFADLYQKYRIEAIQIRMRFHPGFTTTATQAMYMPGNCTWMAGIYYSSSSTFTAPTTISQMTDLPHMVWSQDCPPQSMLIKIGRKDLMKHLSSPWYQTAGTGADNLELIQLAFELAGVPYQNTTNAAAADVIIDMDVAFTGPVDPALIPAFRNHYGLDQPFQAKVTQRTTVVDRKQLDRKDEEKKDDVLNSLSSPTLLSEMDLEDYVPIPNSNIVKKNGQFFISGKESRK